MTVRSTILIAIAALLPVVAAFRDQTPVRLPAPSGQPEAWATARIDSAGEEKMNAPIVELTMLRDATGYAGALGGRIWRTVDGGRSWHPLKGPGVAATAIAVELDDFMLVAVDSGSIFRSTDSGVSWKLVRSDRRVIHDIEVLGDGRAVTAGLEVVLRSTDGGVSWEEADVPGQEWQDVAFASRSTGYIVGGIGQLLRTTDGGDTWVRSSLPTTALLHAVATVDESTVVAVGTAGTILRSSDGGQSWQVIAAGTRQHLRDVAFADSQRGIAVGLNGMLLTTHDGGSSWTRENSGTAAHLWGADFGPDGTPIAVGWLGTIIRRQSAQGWINP
jgi:photosystem II stability/assembly factor-like uncharacterized protein